MQRHHFASTLNFNAPMFNPPQPAPFPLIYAPMPNLGPNYPSPMPFQPLHQPTPWGRNVPVANTKPSTLDIRDENGNVIDLSSFKSNDSPTSSSKQDGGESSVGQDNGGDNKKNAYKVNQTLSPWANPFSYPPVEYSYSSFNPANSNGPILPITDFIILQASDDALKGSNQANLVNITKQNGSSDKNVKDTLTLGAKTAKTSPDLPLIPLLPLAFKEPSNNNLSADLLTLLKTGQLSDMTVAIGGKKLQVHRAILCVRSKYFLHYYSNSSDDYFKRNPIIFEDIKLEVFQALLHFLYTGTVPPQIESFAEELLVAANKVSVFFLLIKLTTIFLFKIVRSA